MDIELKVVNAHVLEPDKHYILEFNKEGLSIEITQKYCSKLRELFQEYGIDNIAILVTDKNRVKLYEA